MNHEVEVFQWHPTSMRRHALFAGLFGAAAIVISFI